MSPGAQASHGKVAASWSAAEEALKGKTASPYMGAVSRKRAGERPYTRLIKAQMADKQASMGSEGFVRFIYISGDINCLPGKFLDPIVAIAEAIVTATRQAMERQALDMS